MYDLRLGKALFFVPDIVDQLYVFHYGAVFTLALYGTNRHAYGCRTRDNARWHFHMFLEMLWIS